MSDQPEWAWSTPDPVVPVAAVPAPIFRRFLARMLDNLIFTGLELLLSALGLPTVSFLAVFVLAVGYETRFYSTTGQTLGKRALGIAVRRADGGVVRVNDAVARAVLWWLLPAVSIFGPSVAVLLLAYGLVLVVPAFVDHAHRGFHDRLAGTVVVRWAPHHGTGAGAGRS
jgi:uncharacterized RDD family membrane protein YckC